MADNVLVTWSDADYCPLTQGLVLSLERHGFPDATLDIVCIDAGLKPAQAAWFDARNIRLVAFDRHRLAPFRPEPVLSGDIVALLARPFLPVVVPGYRRILWCDAAVWIQDRSAVEVPLDYAARFAGCAAITATVGFDYVVQVACDSFIAQAYGADAAAKHAGRPLFNASLFAVASDAPVWGAWATLVPHVHQVTPAGSVLRHAAEQTALNLLLYETGAFAVLDPVHLFQCHIARALTRQNDALCLPHAPFRRIAAVYLADPGARIHAYLHQGMLFDQGAYLSPADRTTLERLPRSWQ